MLRETLDDANQALRNSGLNNVIFAPRGPELLPNEPSPINFSFDEQGIALVLNKTMGAIATVDPPYLNFNESAYVPSRRNAQWADIVSVARDGTQEVGLPPGTFTCGATYINNVVINNGYPREPGGADTWRFAYVVYDPGCNADRLNLAHELGHQLGMEHDPANVDSSHTFTSCPWSFGHRRGEGDPRFRFRTVMAYPSLGNWDIGIPYCNGSANCPQIDAYETPLLEWAGDAIMGGLPPFGLQPAGTGVGRGPDRRRFPSCAAPAWCQWRGYDGPGGAYRGGVPSAT